MTRLLKRQLLALNRLVAELVQVHDIPSLMDRFFAIGRQLLPADAIGVYFLGNDQSSIAQFYADHLPQAYLNEVSQAYADSPQELACRTRQPLAIADARSEPRCQGHLARLVQQGYLALLVLPILPQERLLGALVLYYRQPHPFNEEEIQLGLTLANTLAIAVENARLYQAETAQREFAEALAQGTAAVIDSLDLDQVLDRILEQTVNVTRCRSVNIMLIEGEQARVVRHLDRTDPAEAIRPVTGKSLPLTLPTLQSMLSSGKPLVISNTRLDALWRRVEQTTWIQSYAAAPLRVHGQIIGFLNMNSDQAGFFTQEIVPRLQAFADTAAAAIQNARLYQRVQHYAAELEDRVRERTAELSAAKERIEHILVSVPDAILVLDENRHLIHANPAGEALLVQAEQQGLDIFSPAFLAQLDSGGVPSERNVVQIQERSYQALASPMPFKGSKAAMVIVFRDVTRFRELDRMKTQFISDVSHELRTPLTNLSLYLDLLSATNDAERSQKYLSVLRRETQRLTHMIENLLTISRLETGRVDIHIAPVDVNRLVVDLAQDRKQMAANRDLSLTYVTHPDLPLALADPRLLMQVLSNLLTNALNYTPSGKSVQLQTELRQDDQGSLWVTVSVIDSGLGIRPEEMPYLFTRFFRGAAAQATNAPGTGLGLAISKEMMDHLGGRISVESQVGQGSTFTVWLKAAL